MKRILLAVVFAATVTPVTAKEAEPLEDPVYQERFEALTKELRCLKCQNQTIFDSKAGLADDLRRQIREQMHQGKSDEEIVDYLVARYGDFVRYRPDFKASTLFLWVGPFLFLVIGIAMLVHQIRKRRSVEDVGPLSEEEAKRVRALIDTQGGEKN